MTQKYIYSIKGGSGSTKLELEFNTNDKKFVIDYYDHWMGYDGPYQQKYKGDYKEITDNYYILIIDNQNRKYNPDTIDFFKLNDVMFFQEGHVEYQGMVMGGCEVNITNTSKFQFNSILKLNNICDSEKLFNNAKKNTCFYMINAE
jgi:hypothetical protein